MSERDSSSVSRRGPGRYDLVEESPGDGSPKYHLRRDASVGIVGAGSWGTALAIHLGRKGIGVSLVSRDKKKARTMQRERANQGFPPGVTLPDSVTVTHDPSSLARCRDAIVFAVPSQALRDAVRWVVRDGLGGGTHIDTPTDGKGSPAPAVVSAVKGIELGSLLRMSEVILEELGEENKRRIAVISGPNFAREIALGMPAATVAASFSEPARQRVQDLFMSDSLRVYTNSDVVGVELGGALKNVYAIGVGIIDGMGLGMNARAAFITRALAELIRLGVACGARAITFSGLSGLGDLILTCTGDLSRNRRCGLALAQGERLDDIMGKGEVIEGIPATDAAFTLAGRLGVEMPILAEMHRILFEGKDLREASRCLMTRLKKDEIVDIA